MRCHRTYGREQIKLAPRRRRCSSSTPRGLTLYQRRLLDPTWMSWTCRLSGLMKTTSTGGSRMRHCSLEPGKIGTQHDWASETNTWLIRLSSWLRSKNARSRRQMKKIGTASKLKSLSHTKKTDSEINQRRNWRKPPKWSKKCSVSCKSSRASDNYRIESRQNDRNILRKSTLFNSSLSRSARPLRSWSLRQVKYASASSKDNKPEKLLNKRNNRSSLS